MTNTPISATSPDDIVLEDDDLTQRLDRQADAILAEGEGRKDAETKRMSGRARDGRLVHFAGGEGIRPGDVVEVEITAAAPHHLVADGGVLSHRRTRAGDNVEAAITPVTAPVGVGLGLPPVGRPAPATAPASTGCSTC